LLPSLYCRAAACSTAWYPVPGCLRWRTCHLDDGDPQSSPLFFPVFLLVARRVGVRSTLLGQGERSVWQLCKRCVSCWRRLPCCAARSGRCCQPELRVVQFRYAQPSDTEQLWPNPSLSHGQCRLLSVCLCVVQRGWVSAFFFPFFFLFANLLPSCAFAREQPPLCAARLWCLGRLSPIHLPCSHAWLVARVWQREAALLWFGRCVRHGCSLCASRSSARFSQ
jgi:hypothetical protein